MAHDLDFSRSDNVAGAAVFSVGETMWHREGRVVAPENRPRIVEDALDLAGINWTARKAEVFRAVGSDDYIEVPGYNVTLRSDTNAVLGMVRGRYTPLQNRDAFAILQPLIDNGHAMWETGGALRGGQDVWGLVKFDLTDAAVRDVYEALGLQSYGTIINNHAGLRQVTLLNTDVRIVCRNTLNASLRGTKANATISVRHTKTVEAKVVAAAEELWGDIIERSRVLASQYKALKRTYLDEAMFRQLVLDTAVPLKDEPRGSTDRSKKIHETKQDALNDRRIKISAYWTDGKGHTGDQSAWEAYNGLVEAIDHDRTAFPTRRESIIEAQLYGGWGEIKTKVMTKLLAHAKWDGQALAV